MTEAADGGKGAAGEDPAAVEAEARQLGWVPKENFKGPDERWVSAETFVQRGREVMPILRRNNERLLGEQATLKKEVADLVQSNKELQASVGELAEFFAQSTKEQVEQVRRELKAQLVTAKRDGDVEEEVELTDKLSQLNEKQKAAKAAPAEKKPDDKTPSSDNAPSPEFLVWQARAENSWFGKDARKTRLAIAEAQGLREEKPSLTGIAFFDEVAERVEELLGGPKAKVDKVGGARSTRSDSGGGDGKTYADLPADAKAICDKQTEKFVGANKAFKDANAWRANYCKLYYAQSRA